MKNKKNKILTEGKETMERWKEYFYELLNKEDENELTVNNSYNIEINEETDDTIKREEVTEAIKTIKRGKSAGHDRITAEMVINLGERGTEMLTDLFNKAWNEGNVPDDWRIGIIIPIHKKGDTRDCANYRGITLLSIVAKTFESILEKRLKKETEHQLEESQCGFRKGRSTQDHIFTIKQMIEKSRIKNKEVYVAFLDLEQAFDKVALKDV